MMADPWMLPLSCYSQAQLPKVPVVTTTALSVVTCRQREKMTLPPSCRDRRTLRPFGRVCRLCPSPLLSLISYSAHEAWHTVPGQLVCAKDLWMLLCYSVRTHS